MTQARDVRAPCVVLLIACSGKDAPAPPPTQTLPAANDPWSGSADVPPAKPAAGVVLDRPGAEPRKPLRYTPVPYQRGVSYRHETTSEDQHGLALTIGVDWTCRAGGSCAYQLRSFKPDDGPADPVIMKIVKDARGEVTIQPDGRALIQPTTFVNTTPSLVELLKLSIISLPAAPIGVGATWHLDDGDAHRSYELTAVTPTGFSVSFATRYGTSADPVTGSGTATVELAQPLVQSLRYSQDAGLFQSTVTIGRPAE